MSYDIRLGVRTIATNNNRENIAIVASPIIDSPTYNLGEMFRRAMDWDFNQGEWYRVADVIHCIRCGRDAMSLNPERFRKYEPKNHWGVVEDAIAVLDSLLECINDTTELWPITALWLKW